MSIKHTLRLVSLFFASCGTLLQAFPGEEHESLLTGCASRKNWKRLKERTHIFFSGFRKGAVCAQKLTWIESLDPQHRRWDEWYDPHSCEGIKTMWTKEATNEETCWVNTKTTFNGSLLDYAKQHPDTINPVTKQPIHKGAFIAFFDANTLNDYTVTVHDGIVLNAAQQTPMQGLPRSTKDKFKDHACFVMDTQERCYMYPYIRGCYHHNSATQGRPVLFSGMLKVDEKGAPVSLGVVSGHYRCTLPQLFYILLYFKKAGVAMDKLTVITNARETHITAEDAQNLKHVFNLRGIYPKRNAASKP